MSARHPAPWVRRGGARCYGPAPGAGMLHGAAPGYDLRSLASFFDLGEALAFWRLWDPSVMNYTDGPGEQLTNEGFEAGTANWNPNSGALLSSQAGSLGGGGALHLQVGLPLADGLGWANQVAMTPGARYLCSGWAVGDGVNGKPHLSDGVGHWAGTTSTVPQYFAVEFTASNVDLRLVISGSALTVDSVGFDSLSLTELPGIRTVENDLNPGTYDLDFSLGAQQAWLHPTAWLGAHPCAQFDGVGHYGTADGLAPVLTGSDVPWGIIAAVNITGAVANQRVCSLGNSGSAVPLHDFRENGAYISTRQDTAGALIKTATGATATPAAEHTIALLFSGTQGWLWVDGVLDATFNAADLDVGIANFDRFTLAAYRRIIVEKWLGAYFREVLIVRAASFAQMQAAARLVAIRNFLS